MTPSSSPFMLRQRLTRPGQSDVESGALLDTSAGRPISGGEVTMGLVDEMPEASELGPAGAEGGGGLNMSAAGTGENTGDSSNLSSLAASANQKANV